nr:putative ribonuclease H-like domain-containing protein [Tanacetum cinerariifolium]
MDLEEKHQVFNAAGEELSAAKQKLMMLDSAAERRLLLLSQVKTANEKFKDPKGKDPSSGIRAIWRTLLKKTTFLHNTFFSMDSLNNSLWEVIINGDSPVPTVVVDGVVQPVAHRSAEQKVARRNELKSRGTLRMALPEKHQLKFNSYKDVSAATSVSVVCAKLPVTSHPNIDSLSNAVIFSFFASQSTSPQLDNKDLKQIDVDDLEEMDLRWQMAMLTIRARRFLLKTGRNLGDNRVASMGFDMSKVKCYNFHIKGHFARECKSPKDSRRSGATKPQRRTSPVKNSASNALVSQCDGIGCYDWSYQAEDEPDNFALMLLHHQALLLIIRLQPSGGYHVVLPPITGTFMPPKPDLVFHTAPIDVESDHSAFTVSDSEDEFETNDPQSVPSFVQSTELVKTPRQSVQPVEAPILDATLKPTNPKSNSSSKRKNRKTCFVCKSVGHLIKDCDFHAKKRLNPHQRTMHTGGNLQYTLKDKGVIDNGCSRHMTWNMSYLSDFEEVLLRVPRENNIYNVNLKNIVPSGVFTCPFTKATINESNLWHRRLGHINFKIINKLVKGNLVRGLPTKVFKNYNTYVACKKGKQHRAFFKTKPISSINQPLFRLHMDLFRPIFVKCLNKKSYCLVITDDYSRFTWVFFLATKDETSRILKNFINGLENQLCLKVKVIRSDNGTEFKNSDLNQFCELKGIKREFSIPRTPQQNVIAERKNKTLIVAARTMLADSLLPIPFWAEANRVLVTKPHNKTPYELLHGRTPSIGSMRPFGCPVTILNTLDPLGKFEGKVDEGFLVGYSVNSKAFRVFKSRTRIVQETLHVNFLKNKPNIAGSGPTWLFISDSLTMTINYQPVTARNQSNPSAGFQDEFDAEKAGEEVTQQYMLFPMWYFGFSNPQNKDGDATFDGKGNEVDTKKPKSAVNVSPSSSAKSGKHDDKTKKKDKGKSSVESFTGNRDLSAEFEDHSDNSSNDVNAAGSIDPTARQNSFNSTNPFSVADITASPTHGKSSFKDASQLLDIPDMLEIEDITYSDHENVGAEADFNNLETSITVSPIPTTRTHKDHPVSQIIGDMSSTTQTRSMTRVVKDQGGLSQIFNDDFHTCMFACFLSQEEPKRIHQALKDPSWIEAMQEELFQFKMQKVWIIVDLPHGKRAIGTKWVYRNKKDKRGIVVRNNARLVVQGHIKEEGIDYEEVFAPVARIEAIILFLDYASFMGFMMYQMDVKHAFLYGTIEEEVLLDLASTPIDTEKPLLKDPNGEDVDVHIYRSMIGSLIYLTSSRPDIMFASNDVTRLQALVDRKKVVITEATIRDVLSLDDAEGLDYLPNEEIFAELARMEPEEQGDVEEQDNVDDAAQGADTTISGDDEALDACDALTRRVEHLEHDKVAQALEITKLKQRVKKLERDNKVKVLKLRRLKKVAGDEQVKGRQAEIYQIDMDHPSKVLNMQEDKPEVQEVVEVVTTDKLIIEVVAAVSESVSAASATIATVPAATITAAPVRVAAASTKRRKEVVIRDPKRESNTIIPAETKSKDKGKGIMVEEPKPMKKKQQVKMDEEYARKLHEELNKDIDWDVTIDLVKQKDKEDPFVQRY